MYNIYHIPGNRKIGLTINLKVRLREQGNPDYEVLEVHTDIYEASRREIELQKEYGYEVDRIPYYKTINHLTDEDRAKGGRQFRKLTDENVRVIRSSNKTQRALAAEFGVGRTIIVNILKRNTYKDV